MIFYWIIFAICIIISSVSYIIQKSSKKQKELTAGKYSFDEIKEKLLAYKSENDNLVVELGKTNQYNPDKNKITLVSSESYSNYDKFVAFHELGHYKDKKLTSVVFKVRIAGLLLYIPSVTLGTVCLVKPDVFPVALPFLLISSLLLITDIAMTAFEEMRASNFAIRATEALSVKAIMRRLAVCAMLNQVCLKLILLNITVILFYKLTA